MARVVTRRMVARREDKVRHADKEFTVAIESEDTMVATDDDVLAVLECIAAGITEQQARLQAMRDAQEAEGVATAPDDDDDDDGGE